MKYNEIYKKIIDCNLLNKVELSMLQEEMNSNEKEIVKIIFKHLSIDLIFHGGVICPSCVKDMISLESDKYEQDEIDKMLTNNKYVEDEEYRLLTIEENANLATSRLFNRFCEYKVRQLPNIGDMTIKKYQECVAILKNIKNKDEFIDTISHFMI